MGDPMKILFLLLIFLPVNAWSSLPPTTTKGSADANPVTTFEIDTPNIPITHTGTKASLGTVAVAGGGTGQTSYTDGQLLIGNSTGNTLTKSTLTAGTGVTITNSSGSITIASSGGSGSTQLIVDGFFAFASGCVWSRSSNTLGAFNTGPLTSCAAFTAEVTGAGAFTVDTTTTGTVPQVSISSLPAGTYRAEFRMNIAAATPIQAYLGISDGTNTHGVHVYEEFSTAALQKTVEAYFTYGSSGNVTFTLFGATGTAGAYTINQLGSISGGGPVRFTLIKLS